MFLRQKSVVTLLHSQGQWFPANYSDYRNGTFTSIAVCPTGFSDRDQAVQKARELAAQLRATPHYWLDEDFEWDGQGIPALKLSASPRH